MLPALELVCFIPQQNDNYDFDDAEHSNTSKWKTFHIVHSHVCLNPSNRDHIVEYGHR
jgi:hypothetical protein